MTATFTLTRQDFARFQKKVAQRLRRKRGVMSMLFLLRVAVWFCIGLGVAVYVRLLNENPELSRPLIFLAGMMIAALVATMAMPYLSQALMSRHLLAPNGAFLSPQTVEFTDEALIIRASAIRTDLPWSGVLAREEDDANYYLFVDSMQAVVLPRAALAALCTELERRTAHLQHQ